MVKGEVLKGGIPYGRNFDTDGILKQDVTSLTLVNNTEKVVDISVPTGKRWKILNIKVTNPDNVQRNTTIVKYKEAAKTNLIKTLGTVALAVGAAMNYPNTATGSNSVPSTPHEEIADYPNVITVTWAAGGASAGGTDADGLIIEYLELDV